MSRTGPSFRALVVIVLGIIGAAVAPSQKPDRVVSIYVSTDFEYAEGILKDFEKKTGIKVEATPDTEDSKTVGLVQRIIAEGAQPRADVFWNNECGQTVRLKDKGLLAKYVSPQGATIPAEFKDPGGEWCGFGARARVIIYNTEKIQEADVPKRVRDLADPRFKSKAVMAKPLFGTTLTHICVLYSNDGRDKTDAWLEDLIKNDVQFEKGNAQAMREVSEGGRAFGMTDTDDAWASNLRKRPTKFLYPDQGPSDCGVLLIPNTVMMIKNARHPAEAQQLIDYLLSPEVEGMLANGDSAQIPLHPGVAKPPHVKGAGELKVMKTDWSVVARMLDNNRESLIARFESAARSVSPTAAEKPNRTATWILGGAIVVIIVAAAAARRRRAAVG